MFIRVILSFVLVTHQLRSRMYVKPPLHNLQNNDGYEKLFSEKHIAS